MINTDKTLAVPPRVHTEAEAVRRLEILAQHSDHGRQVHLETSAQRWRHLIRAGWNR